MSSLYSFCCWTSSWPRVRSSSSVVSALRASIDMARIAITTATISASSP